MRDSLLWIARVPVWLLRYMGVMVYFLIGLCLLVIANTGHVGVIIFTILCIAFLLAFLMLIAAMVSIKRKQSKEASRDSIPVFSTIAFLILCFLNGVFVFANDFAHLRTIPALWLTGLLCYTGMM